MSAPSDGNDNRRIGRVDTAGEAHHPQRVGCLVRLTSCTTFVPESAPQVVTVPLSGKVRSHTMRYGFRRNMRSRLAALQQAPLQQIEEPAFLPLLEVRKQGLAGHVEQIF
jgi:hypothetical protein